MKCPPACDSLHSGCHDQHVQLSCASTITPAVEWLLHLTPEACSTKSHPECRKARSRLLSGKQRISAVAHTCGEGTAECHTCRTEKQQSQIKRTHTQGSTTSKAAQLLLPHRTACAAVGTESKASRAALVSKKTSIKFGKQAVHLWTMDSCFCCSG